MRKQYIRWILPIIALLVIATVVVLSPLVSSHAQANISKPTNAITTPTVTTTKNSVKPDYWFGW